jgi:hypothetical protein
VLDLPYVNLSNMALPPDRLLVLCSEKPLDLKPLDLKTEPGFLAIIPEKSQPEVTYPDGGWRAWLTLLGVCVIIGAITVATNSLA